ncbi:MAG TPA: tail fiber domain-containing protein [Candidatus Sumerlaeota bacterium]|nr:MAG: hypothetical protein BWY12_00350 [candidate division BRC1 bacterium ADurb.Bin183]HON49041.1 tail fiber domain-containing protein [Candidatus Sumerlaeota bacterium]HPL73370.1 tail fiber domain-containing protein [Candidatus Sumerlaeota bacterium]
MTKIIMVCIGCVCMMLFCAHLAAQSTSFTYQGQLKDGANPANGTYDLCFLLFTAASGGEASNPIYVDDLAVANGLFSAELDFGSSWFKGSDRWLEISVRPGSVSNADRSGYTKLAPRQKITAGPYALYSHDSAQLGGQHASAFMPAATDNWVNTTGDTMTGMLNITGENTGLNVSRNSSGGSAVQGTAPSYGGYFVAESDTGRGIYGKASSSLGITYGGYFEAASNAGRGIYGKASSGSGITYGGRFENYSTDGCAIFGLADASSGVNAGVAGHTNSPIGFASYFTGVPGSDNYFQRKVGIGRTATTNMLEVEGAASKSTAGNWLANSDARIKTDVKNIENALETLEKVRLVDFEYTKEYLAEHPEIEPRRYMNVIAQEFAEVFPDYVKGSGETLADGGEILQVDAYPLTIYAAAAIQELNQKLINKKAEILFLKEQNANQQKQIDSLEARLAALESAMQKTKD